MSNVQPQSHELPAAGHAGHYAPHENMDKTGAGTYVSSENGRDAVPAQGEEVLEQDAATKGTWFAYIKTKQFWITMLLGQGTYKSSSTN